MFLKAESENGVHRRNTVITYAGINADNIWHKFSVACLEWQKIRTDRFGMISSINGIKLSENLD